MTQLVRIRARIGPLDKTRAISNGYKPTLVIAGQKALSSFEAIEPMPLAPTEQGETTITLAWDWSAPCLLEVGSSFEITEGGRLVGKGIVLTLISREER